MSAMDTAEDVQDKGDPDSNRLMLAVVDKFDGVLFKNGLEFRDDMNWEDMITELEALIFKYYDDLTGGDEDFDPAKPNPTDSETVTEETLTEESLGEEDSEEPPRVTKRAKPLIQ